MASWHCAQRIAPPMALRLSRLYRLRPIVPEDYGVADSNLSCIVSGL